MRAIYSLILAFCLTVGSAFGAAYGDFIVPADLNPVQSPPSSGQTVIRVTLESGESLFLYLPSSYEFSSSPLRTIARSLGSTAEVVVANLAGRPWFGTAMAAQGGQDLYDGYTHRNGRVYRVGFSSPAGLDAGVREALSRLWLLPGAANTDGANAVGAAIDQWDRGDTGQVADVLESALGQDDSNWAAYILQGFLNEANGDLEAAATSYRAASERYPDDAEAVARAAGAEYLSGADNGAIDRLISLASRFPEEPSVWEELGKVYLADEDTATARRHFEEAVAVNPADEIALYNLSFIDAYSGDYENALRRAREFMYYYPWVPTGVVPDVTAAPGMENYVASIMSEPLPLGRLASYGNLTAQPLAPDQSQTIIQIIQVPDQTPVYQPTYYPAQSYVPVVIYDWSWLGSWHQPWWGSGWNRPRPPGGWHPGWPGIRPPRPPSGRPPHPGGRPPGGRPPHPGERPPGGRPPGERPPGERPPRPPSGIMPLPEPVETLPPDWPERPVTRPTPGSERPVTRPAPEVQRPVTRPSPGFEQPIVRPPEVQRPVTRPTPAFERPVTRPAPVQRPVTRPTPGFERPVTRPSPGMQRPVARPAPAARPAPRPQTRPAPQAGAGNRASLARPATLESADGEGGNQRPLRR